MLRQTSRRCICIQPTCFPGYRAAQPPELYVSSRPPQPPIDNANICSQRLHTMMRRAPNTRLDSFSLRDRLRWSSSKAETSGGLVSPRSRTGQKQDRQAGLASQAR
ncbi:hypothetical protein EV126DRAFT_79762 [Verticillium dahliae]|nr:hypothetical protein EV126DRAFT_79762 [Verticillium dahliae]